MARKSKLNFFLVDDDPDMVALMTDLLVKAGHTVTTTDSTAVALPRILDARPDCVMIDLMMPGMDGLELCRELRAKRDLQSAKFIVISAKPYEFDRKRAYDVGADGYITKPLNADTFIQQVQRVLEDRVELTFENAAGSRLHTALERDGQLDIFFPARQRWQLVAARQPAPGTPIRRLGIVLARAPQDQQVLETARLLQQAGLVAELYVISAGPLERKQLDILYRPGSRICVQANLKCDPATISRLIRQSAYDLLLLPGACVKDIPAEVLESALDKAGGQVLVVN